MAPSALSTFVALATAGYAVAQETLTFPATPLFDASYPYPTDAPYQVYPASTPYVRGPQSGYNQCNSSTENQDSLCQTSYVNSLADFCLWAPPQANTSIGDSEGEEVAWCTSPGHGTRLMYEGTIKGAQLLKFPDYWMITGLVDQTLLNIQEGDYGGELDCGGQDERGNPIGGLMYSSAFNTSVYQVNWWTEFIGSNQFCIKICSPDSPNEDGYCQHTLDRIGLAYNCPSKYTIGGGFSEGEFEVCESNDEYIPGIYVENGQTLSYSQPAETVSITTMPYDPPTSVASSSCTTYTSSALWTALLANPSGSASASGSAASASATGKSGSSSGASSSRASSASAAASTGSTSGSASQYAVSLVAGLMGVAGSMALLA